MGDVTPPVSGTTRAVTLAVGPWVGFNRGVDLTVTTSERADAVVITAVGEVDVHTAGRLRSAISDGEQAVTPQGLPIIVDLAGVPFMDSTGLGVLVGALARARDGDRRLILAGPTERIVRLLRLTGLDGQFEVARDADSALPASQAPSGTNQDNSPT